MLWVKERLREYGKGKRTLEKYRAKLIGDNDPDRLTDGVQEEVDVVSGMIADMNYAMEWMRSGRRPHSRKGIDKHDAYSKAVLMDMELFPIVKPEEEIAVSIEKKQQLAKILMTLSQRELQCYLLHMAQGMSLAEIGRELKITKRTVQFYIEKAKAKVDQNSKLIE